MQALEDVIVGIDESNHGRDDEIFIAIFSRYKEDIASGKYKKIKNFSRVNKARMFSYLSKRDYSLVVLQSVVRDILPKAKLIGTIVASLLQNLKSDQFDKLQVYLDGTWRKDQQLYIKDYTSEVLEVEKPRIRLYSGPRYDEKYFIVNLADAMARYTFRKKTYADLSDDHHRNDILITKI